MNGKVLVVIGASLMGFGIGGLIRSSNSTKSEAVVSLEQAVLARPRVVVEEATGKLLKTHSVLIPYMLANGNASVGGVRQIEYLVFENSDKKILRFIVPQPYAFVDGDCTVSYIPLASKRVSGAEMIGYVHASVFPRNSKPLCMDESLQFDADAIVLPHQIKYQK